MVEKLKAGLGLTVSIFLIVAFTFGVHEFAHGIASLLLGYDTFVKLNSSGLISGTYASKAHEQITDAAGPIVTLLQGVVGFLFSRKVSSTWPFLIVNAAFLMRVLAAVASLTGPNDEARLGIAWGVGFWTVHAIVLLVLLALTIYTARATRAGWGLILASTVLTIIAMVVVVIVEPFAPTLTLRPFI
ncbi:hypothetical protein [Aquidulcibacter sp.]|uniref:hypothetical protein n=1 Tax=Aquidulcibacter sp. TaxID=2052990 RepID=UPI0025C53406|nr:hypothetical protein [Aquidulcibacter sp.]MCA3693175.1 hypothetical protein [Aquidulcibacter sp.]